ncbi:MAG: Rrf2 family transcriptional regulator [Bdellovibrionaceae bacterium]|nr:Rrf2 family transcriptional regulator [Pseudobdellovibrionaceae bacterium]
MNKVHRKVEYSLMALKHMGAKANEDLTTAKEVADAFHAPFEAVARALQIMAQKGLLRSEQGKTGGYKLTRALDQITLLEIIEMMEGPTAIAKCLNSGETCDIHSSCNIISPIQNLNNRLTNFYRGLSVQDVLRGPEVAV